MVDGWDAVVVSPPCLHLFLCLVELYSSPSISLLSELKFAINKKKKTGRGKESCTVLLISCILIGQPDLNQTSFPFKK